MSFKFIAVLGKGLQRRSSLESTDRRCFNRIDALMKLACMKIITKPNDKRLFKIELSDDCNEPPRLLAKVVFLRLLWDRQVFRKLCKLFVAYVLIKYLILSIKHIRYDEMRIYAQRLNSSIDQLCFYDILSNNSIAPPRRSPFVTDLHATRWWLELLGDPFIRVEGVCMFIYWFAVYFCLIWIHSRITLSLGLYSDFIGRLLDPISSQLDIRQRISKTTKSVHRSMLQLACHQVCWSSSVENQRGAQLEVDEFSERVGKIFYRIERENLVQPANYRFDWLAKMKSMTSRLLVAYFWLSAVRVAIPVLYLWFKNKSLASIDRFEFLDCNSRDQHKSRGTWLKLAAVYLSIGELYIVAVWYFAYETLVFMILIMSSLDRKRWIRQLIEQQEDCISLVCNSRQLNDLLVTRILSNLINYRVYLSSYRYYRSFAESSLRILMMENLVAIALTYWKVMSHRVSSPSAFYVQHLATLVVHNILFNIPVRNLANTEKFISQMSRLICALQATRAREPKDDELMRGCLVQYLRKYPLNSVDVLYSHALSAFGASLSPGSLQAYNGYKIGLFIYYYGCQVKGNMSD